MLERLRKIRLTSDARKKTLFTLGMLLAFVILTRISIPLTPGGQKALSDLFTPGKGGDAGQLLALLDTFSGGSFQTFSIIALGVYPLIIATVVVQLLQRSIPNLRNRTPQVDTASSRRIIYAVTALFAFLEAAGSAAILHKAGVLENFSVVDPKYQLESFTLLLTLTAGSVILAWISDLISEYGIGIGMELLIFVGIVSHLFSYVQTGYMETASRGGLGIGSVIVFVAVSLLTILGMIYVYNGERRVPIDYPGRSSQGRGLLLTKDVWSYNPMRVPMIVVMVKNLPILIFVQLILLLPALLAQSLATSSILWLRDSVQWIATWLLNPSQWWYWVCYLILVVAASYRLAYLYGVETILNMQGQGVHLPGYRPGEPTAKHLKDIFHRFIVPRIVALGLILLLLLVAYMGANQLLSSVSVLLGVCIVLQIIKVYEYLLGGMTSFSGFMS
jgi:preprotein translocase subunit SecY